MASLPNSPGKRDSEDGGHADRFRLLFEEVMRPTAEDAPSGPEEPAVREDETSEIDRLRRENRELNEKLCVSEDQRTSLIALCTGLTARSMDHIEVRRNQKQRINELIKTEAHHRVELKRKERVIHELQGRVRTLQQEVNDYVKDLRSKMSTEKKETRSTRSFDETSNDVDAGDASAPRKQVHKARVVTCVTCYSLNLPCDSGVPCNHCIKNRKRCIRSKCTDFEAEKCKRQHCTRAHSNDDFLPHQICNPRHVPKSNNASRKRQKGAQSNNPDVVDVPKSNNTSQKRAQSDSPDVVNVPKIDTNPRKRQRSRSDSPDDADVPKDRDNNPHKRQKPGAPDGPDVTGDI